MISNDTTPTETLERYRTEFLQAVEDDLNIPLALGVLWTMTKENKSKDIYRLALEMDKVLGLSLDKITAPIDEESEDIPEDVKELAKQRYAAKLQKDWATADALRAEIAEKGYLVADSKDGYTIKLR